MLLRHQTTCMFITYFVEVTSSNCFDFRSLYAENVGDCSPFLPTVWNGIAIARDGGRGEKSSQFLKIPKIS